MTASQRVRVGHATGFAIYNGASNSVAAVCRLQAIGERDLSQLNEGKSMYVESHSLAVAFCPLASTLAGILSESATRP